MCIPATESDAELCLCSRQFLESANDAVIGDIDGDGVDDVFIHNSFGNTGYAWLAEGGVLVQTKPADWPAETTSKTLHYVRAIGGWVLARFVAGELRFSIVDAELETGPSHALESTGGLRAAAFGEFDGDGILDAVTAVDLDGNVIVTRHLDAAGAPVSTELLNVPVDDRTTGAHLYMTVCDVDGDGADDLVLQAAEDHVGKVYWNASGEGTPFGTGVTPQYVRCFDFDADGLRELLVHGATSLGELQLVNHVEPRQLDIGATVPVEEQLAPYGNQVYPVRLGNRFSVVALGEGLDTSSALGFAYFGALDDLEPLRTHVLEGIDARIVGTLDIEGDGRDEVLAHYDREPAETGLYVFDVVD